MEYGPPELWNSRSHSSADGYQVSPNEMREVVNAFKDKGDATGVKAVQSTGLHIAGEKFIVLKADERSLYGKKVSTAISSPFSVDAALLTQPHTTGQRRHRHRQDYTSASRHALSRDRTAGRCHEHGGAARRLPDRRWILGGFFGSDCALWILYFDCMPVVLGPRLGS